MKVVFFFLLWMFFSTGNSQDECQVWRLPTNVLPTHYDITLRLPDEAGYPGFTGAVKITVNCIRETDTITLHSSMLEIVNTTITLHQGGVVLKVVDVAWDQEHEMVSLKFDSNMKKGRSYVLDIPEYSGHINENNQLGLFHTAESIGGDLRITYCTFFQPTFARTVFPCFDEPGMKATFTVNIDRPAHFNSYSNMPINKTLPSSHSRFLDTFQQSPQMSTYLLAVSVNEFQRYPKNQTDRTSVLVPEGSSYRDNLDIPVTYKVANDALKAMENYTNIPYKLEKLDHLIMLNYEFLGMEHWGLIIYKRRMFSRGFKTAVGRHQMFSLIFHEVAHQWFGNLVTMEWWSYLWLNEAFANYFQYVIGEKILPEMRYSDMFSIIEFQSALEYDDESKGIPAFPLTNKKVCDVLTNYSILTGVAYRKGSSVLRMFQHILGGEDNFRQAIRIYLNNRMMSTATPADLFHALGEVNNQFEDSHLPKDVTFDEVGATWTTQEGVPLVNVKRDYVSGAIHITQERFYQNPLNKTQGYRWWIPLTWTTASAPDHSLNRPQDWLYKNKTIQLDIDAKDWLLMNSNITGYYRVNYDDQNWSLLADGLKTSRQKFPLANRVQIFDDAVNLVLAGRLNIDIAFDISEYLLSEDDPIVWISSEKNLKRLFNSHHMSQYSLFTYYKKKMFIRQLMTKAYDIISEGEQSGGYKTPLHHAMKECLQKFACDLLVLSCYKDRLLKWMPWWITALVL